MGRLARMVAAGVEGRLLGRLGGQERKKSRFLALRGVSAVPNHVCWKHVNLTTHKVARGRLATRVPGRREQSAAACVQGHVKLTMHKVARTEDNAIPGRRERSVEACVQRTCEAVNAQSCQDKGQRNSWQARAECRSMRAGNM